MTSERWSTCDFTKTYCVCPQTEKPAKLAFDKKEGEVFKAKLLTGQLLKQRYKIILDPDGTFFVCFVAEDKPIETLMETEDDQFQLVAVDDGKQRTKS